MVEQICNHEVIHGATFKFLSCGLMAIRKCKAVSVQRFGTLTAGGDGE